MKLTSEERWILASAVSRQIGVYDASRKHPKWKKKDRQNIKRLRNVLMSILMRLQDGVEVAAE